MTSPQAGKPGHPLSNPKPFFNQFKKKVAKRISVADGEHYVDGHAEMRKFSAGLAMTIMLRERSEIDFVDLKGKTINEFYLANLDLPDGDPGATRVLTLIEQIAQLPNFSSLKEGSPMTFQMAFHFALLVDALPAEELLQRDRLRFGDTGATHPRFRPER